MAYLLIGPMPRKEFCSSDRGSGYWPSFETIFLDGLWPKMPLKNAGMRIDPPISDPIPMGEAAEA